MTREEKERRLVELIEPLVELKGYELVRLSYAARRHGLLQLIIDHDKGITVDDCELISRAVSELLDAEDPIEHAYSLEVSSPGLERPLTKVKHFKRFVGEKVKIQTCETVSGSEKFAGTLVDAGDEYITIESEKGIKTDLAYDLIKKAHLWYIKPDKKN